MPQTARIIALILCALGIGYVIYNAVDNAMTETLDETTIRGIYKQGDGFIKDPKATHDFLVKRLNEDFKRTGFMINSVKDKPDQSTPVNMNKAQAIQMTTQGLSMMKIDKYERKIVEVQFNDTHQYAYVSSTEVSNGTVNFPLPNNKKITLPFNEAGSCIDTLMQEKKTLTIVRSECTNKMAFVQ